MGGVARLVTVVDLDPTAGASGLSFSALHVAELFDERRIVLLRDRGWGISGPGDLWAFHTKESLESDARMVVGPDGPHEGATEAEMAAGHWSHLAGVLRQAGQQVTGSDLAALPHDVELSARVLQRLRSA